MFALAFVAQSPVAGTDRLDRLCDRLDVLIQTVPQRTAADSESAEAAWSDGTEVFLLLKEPESVVTSVLSVLREGGWCVGIGIGRMGRPAESASVASHTGSGARLALEAAAEAARRKPGRQLPVLVRGAVPSQYTDAAQAVLRLLGRIVISRSEAEWRVLDQLVQGARGSQGVAAEALGISSQAVSKAVGRSGWAEEQGGRQAAALLLSAAQRAVDEWS